MCILSFNLHKTVREVLYRWEIRNGKSNFKRSFRVSGWARIWTHIDVHQKQALRNVKQNTRWKETFLLFFDLFCMLEATRTSVTFYCTKLKPWTSIVRSNTAIPSEAALTNLTETEAQLCLVVIVLNHPIPKAATMYRTGKLYHYFLFLVPRCEDQSLP